MRPFLRWEHLLVKALGDARTKQKMRSAADVIETMKKAQYALTVDDLRQEIIDEGYPIGLHPDTRFNTGQNRGAAYLDAEIIDLPEDSIIPQVVVNSLPPEAQAVINALPSQQSQP